MHIESILMLIPALQVGIAAAAVAMSGYLMFSKLFAHMGRRLSN